MLLGTALRKECKQGIQRLRTSLRRLIISFIPSLISFIIFSLELQDIEYNRHIPPMQKVGAGGNQVLFFNSGVEG